MNIACFYSSIEYYITALNVSHYIIETQDLLQVFKVRHFDFFVATNIYSTKIRNVFQAFFLYYLLANRNAHIHIDNANIIANTDGHTGRLNEHTRTGTWKITLSNCPIVIKPNKTPVTIR